MRNTTWLTPSVKLMTILKDRGQHETYIRQMLGAALSMFNKIASNHNNVARVYGHDEDFLPSIEELAHLINHMIGSISVFVRKQVEQVIECDKTP